MSVRFIFERISDVIDNLRMNAEEQLEYANSVESAWKDRDWEWLYKAKVLTKKEFELLEEE